MTLKLKLLLPVTIFLATFGTAAQGETKPDDGSPRQIPSDPYIVSKTGERLRTTLQDDATQRLRMEVGQTRLVHISARVRRVSIAAPSVADVQVVTSQQVLITAKSVGYTHLILWGADDRPLVIAVSVTRNLDQLRSQFKELFPKEKINVSAVGDLIVLSGTVSDLRIPVRAAEVARLHTERLANLIEVSGDQQVQLDVRFAEVSRSGLRKAGVNFLWRDTQRGYVGGQSSNAGTPGQYLREGNYIPGTGAAPGPPLVPAPSSADAFNLFFSTGLEDFPFSVILSIMTQEGLAKTLAEPTLVALSGQEAKFHAGGEVPILVAEQLGQVSIRYKKFGVKLSFTPTVLGERSMSLKLSVEVSEPDPSVGVVVTGFQVPGFKVRSSETTIRLKDGQSFAIAGLLSDSVHTTVSKVPGLGDIPILGLLFSSKGYQREETELMMVVTGHLVRPLTPDEVPLLPGEDEYNDPNDFELFLMGQIRTKKMKKYKDLEKQKEKEAEADSGPAKKADTQSAVSSHSEKRTSRPGSSGGKSAAFLGLNDQDGLEGPLGPLGFMRN
jgi:pilus assembly protein CpaC